MEHSANIGISAGNGGKGSMNAGLGIKASNSGGLTVSPEVSFSYKTDSNQKGDEKTTGSAGVGIGVSVNSRAGLKDLSINASYSRSTERMLMIPTPLGLMNVDVLGSAGLGGTSSAGVITFGASTYVPRIQNNMVNNSVALNFKLGTTIFGLDGDITLGGYFSNQSLMGNSSSVPAYGYMFSHNGQASDNVLMDFNREKDQAFSRYTKNLPITNQTYDVFSVTGQGMGGAFRPFRSDVGYMFDNSATTTSDSYSGGVEFAAAQTAHLGVNISVVDVHTTTGKWSDDNDAMAYLSAKGDDTGQRDYEPYYFKEVGEKSEDNVQSALYDYVGKDEAKRLKIINLIDHKADNVLETTGAGNSSETVLTPNENFIHTRQKRNQVMSTLNVAEARNYGLDKRIYNGTHPNGMNMYGSAKDHHIAEITTLRLDGTRYIYGLPAYNTTQEEITFNASEKTTSSNHPTTPQNTHYDITNGYVTYNTGDRSTSNGKGIDHYYNNIKTPAYAHSYLLTAVISPDYVDLKNDGPTDDDFGNYTKFEYEKVNNYKWRMPYDDLKANFNEGGKSIENDDQGNFIFGEKELWFTTKVETKNYIAIFKLADRNDAVAANTKDGGISTKKTKCIESISLYSKPDYKTNGANAIPIKVVHFVYDYSLCQNVPNSLTGQGKLTLKEIYFTYGKSDKAYFSRYKFKYDQAHASNSSLSSNFQYHSKAYDRWGNYMPLNNNSAAYTSVLSTEYKYTAALNNSEFPYTDQMSKADADFRASAWSLTDIELPSGGSIKINYESDDYAFVQNRPAMQMMKILDITNTSPISSLTGASTKPLFNSPIGNVNDNNLFLHFELTDNSTTAAQIKERYLKDINSTNKFLYFRCLVNLTNLSPGTANAGDHFEYVSGYAELEANPDCGVSAVVGPGGHKVAYLKLKGVSIDDKTKTPSSTQINPIAKAAMNFGKSHYNNIVWDGSYSPPADVIGAVKQLAGEITGGFAKQMIQAIAGPNKSLSLKGYCNDLVLRKSWIRLYNPNGHKFGGGSRVKSLSISDHWKEQTVDAGLTGSSTQGQEDSEYGQEYTYETEFNGEAVSSGVASYEPMLGGDENPFRQPVFMGPNKWSILTPDERFFMEEPFGETFFPSASIAYSNIKVKNKIPSGVNVNTHGTGYVVHEFYTAKDYPTITSHTSISPKQWKPALGGLLKIMARDYVSASQGYVIKLNDMHGKAKGQAVYPEGSTVPISRVEYFYKTKGGYTNYGLKDINSDASCVPNELDNTCVVIEKDGTIKETTIGMDFDAVADFRENETTTIMGGAQINLSMFLVGVFPGIVPTIWPDFSYEKTRFRSAVFTKVISNYGILERTTAHDLGSQVTTSNLAYDAQTGDVLVTKTKNDFEDDIYSVKYPAFWHYDKMGPAYGNIGLSENGIGFSNGIASVTNASSYYNIGDELSLGGVDKAWICDVQTNSIKVIDKDGLSTTISGNKNIKVLRSGKRNLLGMQMASLTSLKNPIDFNDDGTYDATLSVSTNHKVLNTSAVEYSDQWQTFKGYDVSTPASCTCSITPEGLLAISSLTNLTSTPIIVNSGPGASTTTTVNVSGFSSTVPGNICNASAVLIPGTGGFAFVNNWAAINLATINSYGLITDPVTCTAYIRMCGMSFYSAGPGPSARNTQMFPFCFKLFPGPGCAPFVTCTGSTASGVKCGVDVGDLVNPFVYGIKGNWRPKTTWSALEKRGQTVSSVGNNNIDIRKDGSLLNYNPFYSAGTWAINNTDWTFTSAISKHTPNGVEVENVDALGRYSSALYGYNESLPIAVASNAKLQEIAFDGFEDYNYGTGVCDQFTKEHHLDFYAHKTSLDQFNAHTGKYSMKVLSNSNLSTSRKLMNVVCNTAVSPTCAYLLTCSDFIYPFTPITYSGSKKYILSYWVKEKNTANTSSLNYQNSDVVLSITGGSGSIVVNATRKSDVIDGWQRYEKEFTISSLASGKINVALTNTSASSSGITSYFDDIRIHPFNSNMKSFVYNPVNLKYAAELDANNFATFYEYDEEGSLVRIKKETEKGIMTIQETKNHTQKH